ncbi:hypothetical protein ABA31_29200 [Agrococcus baldri]|uniref:Uncharacterized protein n=1 Tax=Agrococcus baldri TaxID=153730 RepID=A0AA87UTD3_9MICO|nr:hypothetical protein ABA31_29200 [Agrococcus baldri]
MAWMESMLQRYGVGGPACLRRTAGSSAPPSGGAAPAWLRGYDGGSVACRWQTVSGMEAPNRGRPTMTSSHPWFSRD